MPVTTTTTATRETRVRATCTGPFFLAPGGPPLRDQDHLARAATRLDVLVRLRGPREGPRRVDVRADPAVVHPAHDLLHPAAEPVDLVPHVAEVDPEDAVVPVHQR